MDRKPIFDAVRQIVGRGFSQAEVDAVDGAIDAVMEVTGDGSELPVGPAVGAAGLALIQQFEGCAKLRSDGLIEAYPDPGTGGAPWTIGWGSTIDETGAAIARGAVWTQARADARFAAHVAEFAEQVAKLTGADIAQHQFDALVSFAYNCGATALAGSTLLKLHRAGDHSGAAAQFARWNKAGGRVLAGLTRRRAAEAQLYVGP